MKGLLEKLGNGNVIINGLYRAAVIVCLFLGSSLLGLLIWLGQGVWSDVRQARDQSAWDTLAINNLGEKINETNRSLYKQEDTLSNVLQRLSRIEGRDGRR